MTRRQLVAWLIHLYTATGALLSGWAILAITREEYRLAWLLIGITIAVDATDGVLARRFRVAEVLPAFNGRRLDDLVDYLCWVFVPVMLLVHAAIMPAWVMAAPLLASGYGFGQADAKTPDHFFLGFPSYWSILGFVLFELQPPQLLASLSILVCSLLVFVPVRYPYPSRMTEFRRPTIVLGLVWGMIGLLLIMMLPERPRWLIVLFCSYPIYYLGLTIYFAWQRRRTLKSCLDALPGA